MIHLNSSDPAADLQQYLEQKQAQVDQEADYSTRRRKANHLWNSKRSSQEGNAKFDQVQTLLVKMTIGIQSCNYCENNEAIDIEHIYPKGAFPGRTFRWDNYILACKKCNSHYKLDKFAVFNPADSLQRYDIPRGAEAPTEVSVLINPREEEAMDYLWLDIVGRTFRFAILAEEEGTLAYQKASYTLELLGLNKREALVSAREKAAKYYYSRLRLYVQIKAADSLQALEELVDPFTLPHSLGTLSALKTQLCEAIRRDIVDYPHTTVWKELIRQRELLPRTHELFIAAPEALGF